MFCFGLESTFCFFVLDLNQAVLTLEPSWTEVLRVVLLDSSYVELFVGIYSSISVFYFEANRLFITLLLDFILYLNLGISQKMQLKILISGLEIETGWCCQSRNI